MNKKKISRLKKAGKGRQVAALPVRWTEDGKLEILLVTSRDTGRWVLPKGWRMDGKSDHQAASIEAHEEAGARGYIHKEPLGKFRYRKQLEDGHHLPTDVQVYPMVVETLDKTWKEDGERKRKWFSVKQAAKLVHEDQLSDLMRMLKRKPKKQKALRTRAKKNKPL
ncbi:NUDIX hydrolase [Pseudoruegeria sp. SHC-113]|uniref:NUDIX hydrolase n=1 Tax=Pseudoruegeria sp. SHC-113 TaxID=2855439 RepID=UPI0021BB6007|nr:NUDIX hydrolase [Pseudoruegeria sp. SHC-113]MCT8160194.1 NUDIX hydrolase [Pseudoruegeria sp. SHC-113]